MTVDSAAYGELAEKEEKLQKQILQLSEENIELKFEVEQARKDIPRLKVNTQFAVQFHLRCGFLKFTPTLQAVENIIKCTHLL